MQEPWIQPDEGQLAVDVIENYDKVIIRSAIAGVTPENLDVYITQDIVTIRGKRTAANDEIGTTYHFRECYWGGFSRTIVLPALVKPDESVAALKGGILTITMPKAIVETKIPIRFEED